MKILVCGGRDYNDTNKINQTLTELAPNCVIHGGARGADILAAQWAKSKGIPAVEVLANWDYYQKAAGPIRNKWMLEFCEPDIVVAFPGGRGTANMIEQAEAKGIKVIRVA